MKYAEILRQESARLMAGGIPEPDQDAWLLFEHAFQMNRMQYFMDARSEAPADQHENYKMLIDRRLTRVPVQQIIGISNFMGYDFQVNESVLTPRHDTEVLVELAYKQMIAEVEKISTCTKNTPYRILDMCTGSGCIGMSMYLLARERGIQAEVTCVDLSQDALAVARRNNDTLCEGKVRLVHSDLFQALEGENILYDMILSNPPYIRSDVIETLSPEVKDHEPLMALDGSGDGLVFYRKLSEESGAHIKDHGRIFLEIGYDQGDEVKDLFNKNGFTEAFVHKDLAGLNRVVSAVFAKS